MSTPQPASRQELEASIVQKAWEDEAFCAALVAAPAATIASFAGVPAIAEAPVVVHREAEGEWHIVLPAKPSSQQLSDDELAQVAGGSGEGFDSWERYVAHRETVMKLYGPFASAFMPPYSVFTNHRP